MQDFQRVIGRALLDEHFRAQLFSDPNAALQGFNLSPEEIQTLQHMSPEQFNALAQQFGQQLPGEDVLNKAVGEHIKKAMGEHIKKAQFQAGDPAAAQVDYYKKVSPGYIEQDNIVKHADLIKGEANFQKVMPGDGSPPPRPGSQVVALVVIAIIAILIGLLLPAAFAPTDTVKGALNTMGFSFACAPAPEGSELPAVQMADGSVMPAGGAQVAVGDVNGDGVSDEADVAARKAGGQQQDYLIIKFKEVMVTGIQIGGASSRSNPFDLGGILIGLNDMRLAVGNEGFLPDCGDNTPDPQDGEMATEGEDGGVTGGATGGTTGGQPEDVAPPDGDLCANNGGIQWQGTACVCPGLIDNVTMCADGTKIDQVTDQTCVPDQTCDQPTDPQNPPPACPCTLVCVQWSTTSVAAACSKYEGRDCTGAVCTPPQTP